MIPVIPVPFPLLLLALVASVAFVSCRRSGADDRPASGRATVEVMVFAAASLRTSLEEIADSFEQESNVDVAFNFAGSNSLARQILATNHADVFVSAAENWMDTVEAAGRTAERSRADLLSNRLIIVGRHDAQAPIRTPCELARRELKAMAIGDPGAVPAGRYAREWMETIPCDGGTLWSQMQGLVVPAPDVRAALALVLADPRIVGIVYRTDWISMADRLDSLFEVSDGPTITYVAATLVHGPQPDGAERFRRYLLGPVASDIFARNGFTHINRSAAR